jgi:hypothetical protein
MLIDKDLVVFEPLKQTQLIIGSNGGGKSSLLKELTPIPAEIKKSYKEGGYKEITIQKGEDTFVLRTDKKHYFYLNGENLNTDRNKRVQLSLIKEHFNMDVSILKVTNGYRTFTDMSTAERKTWLTTVSNTDFDYPLQIFAKFKSRLNSLKGALNLLRSKKLEDPSDSELSESKLLFMKENVDKKIDKLTDLLKSINPTKYNLMELDGRLNVLSDRRDTAIEEHKPLNKLETELGGIINEIAMLKSFMDKVEDEKKVGVIASLEDKLTNITIPTAEVKVLEYSIRPLRSLIKSIKQYNYEFLNDVYGLDINNMRDELYKLKEELKTLTTDRHSSEIHLDLFGIREKASVIICPSCNHSFKDGYSKQDHDDMKNKFNTLDNKTIELTSDIKNLSKLYDRAKYYKDAEDSINNLIDSFDISWLVKYKSDIRTLENTPYKLNEVADNINAYLTIINDINDMKNSMSGSTVIGPDNETILDIKLDRAEQIHLQLLKEIKEAKRYKVIQNNNEKIYNEMDVLFKMREVAVNNEEIIKSNESLRREITKYKLELDDINNNIVKTRTSKAIIKARDKDIREYEKRIKDLTNIVEEMSPTTGLIGKLISSDLALFIKDMNRVIASIWNHDMEIIPMSIEDNELTYRFPVKINGEYADDVSVLSASQMEIVNLAFRMISMARLNITGTPFILDEFARTFDIIHAARAFDVVDDINELFSQVFIVSHFESTYEQLKDKSDVSVLTKEYLVDKFIGIDDRITIT